ncbi:MAG: MBL fold metallo-hydrolase [Treponema sp.]|nr:MBL fold metallo-hydrolase [Treponema sp.]
MKVQFWGVRGSIPTPITTAQIQAKIQVVIQRITAKDILSLDAKEKFLASLPKSLFGTVGGNTACVELITNSDSSFIIDAGSGIRSLGKKISSKNNPIHIFISHFHWDHIQGLPFFDPLFIPNREVHFYSFMPNCKDFFAEQMKNPFFPVSIDAWSKNVHYHYIKPNSSFKIDGVEICAKEMSHPGNCYAYKFQQGNKKIIYSSDVEINHNDFNDSLKNDVFFKNADALIMDAQYTLEESFEKENWGHTPFCYAVDFASGWNVKKLFLFHHEPTYDDKKLHSMLQSAQWYNEYSVDNKNIEIFLATEGTEFDI